MRWVTVAAALTLTACASGPALAPGDRRAARAEGHPEYARLLLDRATWGASTSAARALAQTGEGRWLEAQLRPGLPMPLPAQAQAQIDAMTIVQRPLTELVLELEARRRAFDAIANDEEKKSAQQAYQQELTRLGREATGRMLLRALYSPQQLRDQMTWFWFNHFNIHLDKANIRALVGDYEERAIRPYALGRFRELLSTTTHHPAMLIYLDNAQNASNRINENYARELLELHTLGVDGGYTQKDVQELARILTGFGVNMGRDTPPVRPALQAQYVREGLFEFIPGRHDYGDKEFLGHSIKGRGMAELDEALDILARHPATARFVCRKLAVYLVSDDPPAPLVARMAAAFQSSDGDIAAVLRLLFSSEEFAASLGRKFKDPLHYVISAVRLAYDDKVILNTGPMINWLNRMGELPYGRQTPDGYPLISTDWASPGQLATRFEVARALGYGAAGLFRAEGPQGTEQPAFPQLANALYYQAVESTLSEQTRLALSRASSPQEWNMLLLASPEFMNR